MLGISQIGHPTYGVLGDGSGLLDAIVSPDSQSRRNAHSRRTNAPRSPHLYPKHPTPHKPHNPILSITYRAMHSKSGLPPRTKGRDATALDANAPRRVVLAVCHWQRLTAARMR